jgi:hypothetical protein
MTIKTRLKMRVLVEKLRNFSRTKRAPEPDPLLSLPSNLTVYFRKQTAPPLTALHRQREEYFPWFNIVCRRFLAQLNSTHSPLPTTFLAKMMRTLLSLVCATLLAMSVSARGAGECAALCNDLRFEVLTLEMCR